MENYRGSFPHHGLHDARYSQNTSVSDGGYGPGSSERDAKIRDYKYSAEYERKHGRHYRDAVAGVRREDSVRRPGPRKDKEEENEDEEDVTYDVLQEKVAPAMALHKDAPALESVKTSPDTKTITVSKEPSSPVSLPPAAEVVKVQAKGLPDGELIAATLRSAEVLQEVSEKDMALIRATLRSAEAVTETSFSTTKKKPVASKSTTSAVSKVPVISDPVPVREEPPSMQMFNKEGETKTPATSAAGTGGYKVHQRVVVTPVVSKAPVAVSSSPKVTAAAAAAVLPKVVLPVDTKLSDELMDDDADLNMLLIPQATAKSIRV